MEVEFGKPLVHIFQRSQKVQYSGVLVFLLNRTFEHNPLEKMHEQISSSTIEFEPFLHSPHGDVLNHDRDTTTIFHDESLEIENSWARESSEALTLEF